MHADVSARIRSGDTILLDGDAATVADIYEEDGDVMFQLQSGAILDSVLSHGELEKRIASAESVQIHR